MYNELIKDLRYLAKVYSICNNENMKEYNLAVKAADAIEDLSREYESIAASLTESVDLVRKLQSPRWIPVTERLPEERGNYLVVINCPRGQWDEICAFDGEKEWVSIDEYAEIATKWVTHWMPLPEPPEESE